MSQKKEALFSKKNKKLITDPLDDNNPITVQVLGICSALAITVQLKPAVVMSFSVLFVLSRTETARYKEGDIKKKKKNKI